MTAVLTHRRARLALQAVLVAGACAAVVKMQWLNALATAAIVLLTLVPVLVQKRYEVFLPPQLELLASAFIVAALFLGEVHGYYTRFWWWDLVLHVSSGVLLGIVGFLLTHVLNEIEEIGLSMRPGFVALFAFLFALGCGALWEVFEFSMDRLFGTTMQKPTPSDPSGLTDTMSDLMVDAIGAAVIAVLGYGYIRRPDEESFLKRWIRAFVRANPRLFRRGRRRSRR